MDRFGITYENIFSNYVNDRESRLNEVYKNVHKSLRKTNIIQNINEHGPSHNDENVRASE